MLLNRSTTKLIISIFIVFVLLFQSSGVWDHHFIYGDVKNDSPNEIELEELEGYITDIINWKASEQHSNSGNIITKRFLEDAGETSTDWYVFSLGRAGLDDDYAAYLAVIKDMVEKKYQTEEKLSISKATEWHRISLAILSAGGDPTNIGKVDGEKINLIADGTYNRGESTKPLGAQGINGWIWGLITLDSLRYKLPENAVETRNSMIEEILRAQLKDGGFSLNTFETESNVDLTAMAIQALAPYYNSEKTYTYKQIATDEKVTKKVRDVVDEALQLLSDTQLDDGDYELTGLTNVESTAQVIVALTSLGVDPLTDERFIKNGHTLLDAVLKYKMADGGFIHSDTLDEANENANPNESNAMASEQVLYTLISLYRFYDEKRTLYDFRKEMSDEVSEKVTKAKDAIDMLQEEVTMSDQPLVEEAFQLYEDVPITERSYVYNYSKLAKAMETLNIDNTSDYLQDHMGENEKGKGSHVALFSEHVNESSNEPFTNHDKLRVDDLLEAEKSTEYYVEVVTLLDKLHHKDTKKKYDEMIPILESLKTDIEKVDKEIEQINHTILDELYPFNDLSKDDQVIIEDVMERYTQLTDYDQSKVQGYDDVKKAATQINSLSRATYITIGMIIVIIGAGVYLVIRYKKRKQEKRHQKMMDDEM